MKKFLLAVAVLSICINAALAGGGSKPSGGGSHPGGSKPSGGTKPSSTPNKPSNPVKGSSTNKSKGSKPSLKGHAKNWHGWNKRHYSNRLGCWLYWSAEDSCWYRYDDATETFVPCDDLTSENLND